MTFPLKIMFREAERSSILKKGSEKRGRGCPDSSQINTLSAWERKIFWIDRRLDLD